ncbi:uncharacterized protein [Malus domestica]|uniref:uncharacterized protein isoform X3 n=1 Tax=Malus domestica TaxID=3750 RepID=UPI003976EA74
MRLLQRLHMLLLDCLHIKESSNPLDATSRRGAASSPKLSNFADSLIDWHVVFQAFATTSGLAKLARRVFSLYEGLFPVPGGAANTTGLKVATSSS